ncbi:MAG TPA: helix-turn-helix domain-containing protein [Amycolatopsis sp.]|uniref:winged helix-turn-helix transcriptional regulator n=1 Tax=Amycolatopsis sp. TaxID=37632 RepID=UPI002B46E223|nr:helix-turn-helix domain-containing protein [Amycolatopsis sp.]HKS46008.1 helix-turn-helix domain-containing protein [Amycolatopsis sp.]
MRHKSFENMDCAVARTLDEVGEWWSLLIVRDALHGLTRFDEFQRSLGISPNSLTRRLNELCDAGLLGRHRYQNRPPRDEYRLTARGRDLQPVIEALAAWGRRHVTHEKGVVRLLDTATGAEADPVLVDRHTGRIINPDDFRYVATPTAHPVKRRRLGGDD